MTSSIERERPRPSSQMRNPGLDLRTAEHQKIYTALLERRLIYLTKQNIQLRGVAEAATGMPYDSFDPSGLSYDDILEHVAQDMAKGLNLSLNEARKRVDINRQTSNPE